MTVGIKKVSAISRISIKKINGISNSIGVDSTSAGGNGTTNSNTLTWSHTIGNHNDRILIFFVPISQAITISSVKYNGVSLTQFVGITNGNPKAYIYYMINPPVGTENCQIIFNTSVQYLYAGAGSFYGIDQINPLLNATTAKGTSANKNNSINCTYNNSYILECYGAGTGVNTPGSGQTRITYDNRLSSYDDSVVVGSNSQIWTCPDNTSWAWVGCELKAGQIKKFMGVSNI